MNINTFLGSVADPRILNLGTITRYNNRFKIHNENVAEHSFYVTATVLKICSMLKIPDKIKYEALEMAVVHDIPEIFLGDVPYDTKKNNPEVAAILTQAEITELEKYMPEYSDYYKGFVKAEQEDTLTYLIVKLADSISVLQYTNLERQLGNGTKDMQDIYEDSILRVERIVEKIREKLS